MASIFCDFSTPDFEQFECGSELGGIVAVGFIDASIDVGSTDAAKITNLENSAWWTAGLDASPQTHWVVKDTRGTLPAGTPTEEEGFGLVPTERTGDDREATWEVLGVMNNRNFVGAINKKRNMGFVYVTAGYDSDEAGYESFYVEKTSTYLSDVIDQSIKSRKRWGASTKWSTDMTPGIPFYAPPAIFIS